MEGGEAGTGDVRSLAAVTATGEVVLHSDQGGLTATTPSLSVDNTNRHVPASRLSRQARSQEVGRGLT